MNGNEIIATQEITLTREGILVAEASAVGFPVGLWPDPVVLDGQTFGIAEVAYTMDGELGYVDYRTVNVGSGSRLLRIFND